MGIDFPDVKKIIHWELPANLEQYVQESERAGRNGEQAEAIL
jgi:ATP-dependent DNA helicase RecQ